MPVIIIVSGTHNTGKTTGIKDAMSRIGVKYIGSKDITIVMPAYVKNGITHSNGIGFATSGDNEAIVQSNIGFISSANPYCMVFACLSYGNTLNRLTHFANSLGVTPHIIQVPPLAGGPGIAAQVQNISTQVLNLIP